MSHRRCLAVAAVSLVTWMAGAVPAEDEEVELERIRSRITALREDVNRDIERRDALTAELRDVELQIATISRNLEEIRKERSAGELRQKELRTEQAERRTSLAAERDALAGQLRAAYISGRQERLKLLLNQQDPATLGRLMVYYGYLGRSRAERIATVVNLLDRLVILEQEVAAETRRLRALEERRAEELRAKEQARSERAALVSSLDSRIRESGSEIARLEEQERSLVKLLEDLREALAEFPLQSQRPFGRLEGELAWPVSGTLLHDYGKPRAEGRLKWNGILVAAARGSEVRALYHGRVAFADWLPGLGLLLVLEHGDGYMSLYGHNETLFKTVGDWVAPGEVIANVGDSGGQARPALYFEIRRGTQPLNPHKWFRAALAAR